MSYTQGAGWSQYLIAAVAVVSLVGCSERSNPAAPAALSSAAGSESGAVKGEPGLGPDLAAVKAATAQFHQVERAIEAGYQDPTGSHCEQIAIGAMGIHSANPALLQSQALDPLQPEVLLYLPKEDGGFRLIGVEYVQTVLVRNPATGAVSPWMAQTPWPSNFTVVTPTPQLFGQTFQGPMPGHLPGMPWHWDLHVWVWNNNPSGTFAQWNPAVSCPAH